MSETKNSKIKAAKEAYATAKEVHKLNKEIAKEAHAFNKEAAKEAHAFNKAAAKEAHAINKELVKAGIEDTDALIHELSDDHGSAE